MAQPRKPNKKNPLYYLGLIGAFILTQLKTIVSLLKLGKAGGAFLTMAASVWAYALIYPWQFALGLVLLIFVHELGHVVAAKQKGLPVSAPVFIPFLGALINMRKHPRDAVTEAYMALGGPVLGTIGAVAVLGAGYAVDVSGSPVEWLDSKLLYSLAYTGFMLNLLNLLPIHPLDGGRIATAVTRWLWLVGLVGGLVIIIFYINNPIFFILWALFAYDLYQKFVKNRHTGERRVVTASFKVPAEPLIAQGYIIPGPDHKRELPFMTYSDLDRQQTVKIFWEGLDFQGNIPLMQQGLIHRVQVTRLEHLQKEDGLHLMVHVQVEYNQHEDDAYYEVPVPTRWKFGAAYLLLAGALLGLMSLTHKLAGIV